MWTSEQEKQYVGRSKGWSEAGLDHVTVRGSRTLLGAGAPRGESSSAGPATLQQGIILFYSLCQRFGSPSPEDPLVEGEAATVHLKSHRRFSTKADSSTAHNSYSHHTTVCFHHVQYKTMGTLPLAGSEPWLLHYCVTNVYPRSLSSVSASADIPLH